MADNYSYPLDESWSTSEMTIVIKYFNAVEDYYEKTASSDEEFASAYRAFKEVVPSIAEEKWLDREFEKASGYSCYQARKTILGK
ncbi:MAG: UPF0223 family protein [Streptococcaceae bacterium]|jgi:uncharacterized protein YktA (UPF0223 family)|nr:UPF0223 family protein [Streptococcaceae bacterium]